ncbi:Imm32 family immunity protein [Dactylosporangium maewongense]|uniref:Imm32 family immunity protein n=1 Tax=Dactylosporangium maewongense TaxID=634393 RepID=UPI0031D73928
MTENSLSVPAYDPAIGVVAPTEDGTVVVEIVGGSVEIFGDPGGLRDLARMCLALADPRPPDGAHIHLDAGIDPLDRGSASLMLARHNSTSTP